jgi:hypothetical protein
MKSIYFFFFILILFVRNDIVTKLNSAKQPLIDATSNYTIALQNYFQNLNYSNPDQCKLYLNERGFLTKCDHTFPTSS